MFTRSKTSFNVDRHVIGLMTDVPFFAEISRHIKKVITDDIPTAAISFDPKSEDIVMGFNPTFMDKLGNLQVRGTLIHEFYHLIFGHITTRRQQPPILWNIATDCAINSLIMNAESKGRHHNIASSAKDTPLPPGCLIPGQWPTLPDGRETSKEEKKASTMGKIISELPLLKSSEFYFYKIKEEAEKLAKENGECGGESQPGEGDPNGTGGYGREFDDHSFWDNVPDGMKPVVEGKVRDIVEKAVKHADSLADGWGNIPSELANDIRKSVSRIVNWRQVLRQFAGSLVRGKRRTSIKKINKRYPYIHPGTTKGYVAKLLVAIDQSGSVDNGMLELFFAELRTLNKNVEIDILPFDCVAHVKDVYTWKRGACPLAKRTKAGGTDFNAPTNVANDPLNRGRWDGLLIMTDGCAPKPIGSRIKRGWVLGKGCKLEFGVQDIVISLDDGAPKQGAWR